MTPYDVKSLEDLLLRISALVEDNPQITEMDLNPVKYKRRGRLLGCRCQDNGTVKAKSHIQISIINNQDSESRN